MNRNVESHFAELPQANIQRSILDLSHGHMLTGNCGDVIPIMWTEILPGDTFDLTTSCVIRLQTLLTPIMGNVYVDTFWWFIPNRLTFENWKYFMGENKASAWIPQTTYNLPKLYFPSGGFDVGTLGDYMGVPVGVEPYSGDTDSMLLATPFRAYALCMNEFMRDQNLTDPIDVHFDATTRTASNGDNYITDIELGGKPFKAAKFHDFFTSCLPGPQKSAAVNANLIDVYSPVGTLSEPHDPLVTDADHLHGFMMKMAQSNGSGGQNLGFYSLDANPGTYQRGTANASPMLPTNLYAHVIGNTTVNELRLSFQMQKYYEKLARGGSRYREIILEMFNVHSPDARMMIPEYLGGHRFPVQIHQVTNTSQGENAFLGDLGAMSNTADVHSDFVKSFTEHGILLGCMVVRYEHSYSTGLSKMWTRSDKLSYYWPVFSALGEMPVYKRELCLSTPGVGEGNGANGEVFGYQEAWAEYRYLPNSVSGLLRPNVSGTLASWNLTDDYDTVPTLSDGWIREDKTNLDRTLAVTSAVSHQFLADFYFKIKATRPMPVYSIPGLIDHF